MRGGIWGAELGFAAEPMLMAMNVIGPFRIRMPVFWPLLTFHNILLL